MPTPAARPRPTICPAARRARCRHARSSASRTPRLPGVRRSSSTSTCRRRATGRSRSSSSCTAAAGGWAAGTAGPAYRAPPRPRSSGWPRPASPSPASTTASPARRPGRHSCTTPRPPSAGCAHVPTSSASIPTGSPPGASRPAGTSPQLLGLTGDDAMLEGDVGIVGTSSHVSAVVAWYAQRHRRDRGRHRGRPGGPAHPRGAAPGRPRSPGARNSPRRPARSPTSPPTPRRSCCCTAGRPVHPVRAERAALRRAGRGRVRGRVRRLRGRRPHVAGLARGRRSRRSTARSTS